MTTDIEQATQQEDERQEQDLVTNLDDSHTAIYSGCIIKVPNSVSHNISNLFIFSSSNVIFIYHLLLTMPLCILYRINRTISVQQDELIKN